MAWLTLASPKVATAIASSGRPVSIPSLAARGTRRRVPTAFGTWLAIVLVWGGTQVSLEPQTLQAAAADGVVLGRAELRSVSKSGVPSSTWRRREAMKAPER